MSEDMEVITSNWDSISKRIWGSEYPFHLNGEVSKDSEAPFSEELAWISVSLLTSNKKAKAKAKPKPDYDGSRKKEKGKEKKGESSSGSSERTDDSVAGMGRLRAFWMSSSDSEAAGEEVSAAGNYGRDIQVVVD